MKKMTCKELGGACNLVFKANTFEEIAAQSKQHGMEMYQQKDQPHLDAMKKMTELMKSQDEMKAWMDNKRKEFNALPEI